MKEPKTLHELKKERGIGRVTDGMYARYGRDQRIQKFYSSARWGKLRQYILRRHPLCVRCSRHGRATPAEHVHHIVKVRDAWHLRLNTNNLMALCPACHAIEERNASANDG